MRFFAGIIMYLIGCLLEALGGDNTGIDGRKKR